MAASKNTSCMNQGECICHLCKKQRFECRQSPTTCPLLRLNTVEICAHDLTRLTPPNIFCPYNEMWRSQFCFCCCTNHSDIKDCEVNWDLKPKCECFKCCKICAGKADTDNDCFCHLKDRLYIPCIHYRGKCKSLQ